MIPILISYDTYMIVIHISTDQLVTRQAGGGSFYRLWENPSARGGHAPFPCSFPFSTSFPFPFPVAFLLPSAFSL